MPKLFKNVARMFRSLRNIFHEIFYSAAKNSNSLFQTIAITLATTVATSTTVLLIGFIVLTSFPLGIFTKEEVKNEAKVVDFISHLEQES